MNGLVSRRTCPLVGAVAVVASLTLSTGVSSSAAASTTHAVKTPAVVFRSFDTFSVWGGYVSSERSGAFTSATASWIEPKVTCRDDESLYAPWVGIDGYGSEEVEQTGVQTYCGTGKPKDSAWYEMSPLGGVYYPNKVTAGDAITATVTSSGSTFRLTISDTTRGWTQTVTQSSDVAQHASAE